MVGLVLATSGQERTGLPQAGLRLSAGHAYKSTLTFFLLFRPEILNFSRIGRKVRVELSEQKNREKFEKNLRTTFIELETDIED